MKLHLGRTLHQEYYARQQETIVFRSYMVGVRNAGYKPLTERRGGRYHLMQMTLHVKHSSWANHATWWDDRDLD